MLKTKEQIIAFLEQQKIHNYVITDELIVNVEGDVFLSNQNMTSLPIQFGVVKKSFDCSHNQLHTLLGAPKEVGTYFNCANNQLTSLEYGPEMVGGTYQANHNQLTNLKHVAQKIGNDLMVCSNKLENLLYCPSIIPGYLNVADNQLKTLLGCAQELGALHAANNHLKNLEHIAKHVHFLLIVDKNPIDTFDFLPEKFDEIRFCVGALPYDFSDLENSEDDTMSLSAIELRKMIMEHKLNLTPAAMKKKPKI